MHKNTFLSTECVKYLWQFTKIRIDRRKGRLYLLISPKKNFILSGTPFPNITRLE